MVERNIPAGEATTAERRAQTRYIRGGEGGKAPHLVATVLCGQTPSTFSEEVALFQGRREPRVITAM